MSAARALLVGVDDYDHYTSLSFCAADVSLMRRTLEDTRAFGVGSDRVTTLTTGGGTAPTKAAILGALDEEIRALGSGEALLIYFAGHGKAHRGKPYLLAQDTQPNQFAQTAIAVEELLSSLRDASVPTRVFVLDSCHSGVHRGARRANTGDPGSFDRGLNRLFLQDEGSVVFSSATLDEIARETILDGEGHGIFTYAFAESLKEQRHTALSRQFCGVETLHIQARGRTVELSRSTQHPRLLYAAGLSIPLFPDIPRDELMAQVAGTDGGFTLDAAAVDEIVQLFNAAQKAVVYAERQTREYNIIGITNLRDALSHLVSAMRMSGEDDVVQQLAAVREHLRRACLDSMQVAAESGIAEYEQGLRSKGPKVHGWPQPSSAAKSGEVLERALELYREARDLKDVSTAAELTPAVEKFAEAVEVLNQGGSTASAGR